MVKIVLIGKASVEIRAIDKFFESDVKKIVSKIKPIEVPVIAKLDTTDLDKQLDALRGKLAADNLTIKTQIDMSDVTSKMEDIYELYQDSDLEIGATVNTDGIRQELDDLQDQYENDPLDIPVSADTARAEALINAAARNRRSNISVDIDPRTRAALTGFFNTVTGTLPIDAVRTAISGVVAGFEGLATRGTIATSAIGALSAAVGTLGGNLVTIVSDIGELSGLLAALPAGAFAFLTIMKANKFAWENFSAAAHDNSEKANAALAKLPPTAQEAAISLRGVREAIQEPVQTAFWDSMGDSIQNLVATQLPSVIRGMTGIAGALGEVWAEAINVTAGLGDFNDVFENVEVMLQNIVRGIQPAIEGLALFVGIGSQRLPMFGDWLSDIAEKFGAFAERSAENGDILKWIDQGVQRLQELGSIVVSTSEIIGGLAEAARAAGSSGLTELAGGFQNVADIVNGEPFQSRMITMLEGARSGTEKLGAGVRTLTDYFSESAESVSIFLDLAGDIAGLAFENITALFAGTGLGSGLYDALAGAREALQDLEPGFRDFGILIGDLGTITGSLLESMAPGLNQLAETLRGMVAGLQEGILAAMPVFNEFIQSLIGAVQGPLITVAEAVGNILEVFAMLPSGVQTAVAALGLILLLKPKFDALWASIQAGAARAMTGVAASSATGVAGLSPLGTSMDKIRTAWQNVGNDLRGTGTATQFMTTTDRMRTAAESTGRAIGTTAKQGLRGAGLGLMGMMGGPWGLALAGAITAVSMFSAEQEKTKAKVEALAGALDAQTGAFTSQAKSIVASDILDLDATAWDDFFRSGRRNMEELARDTRLNMQEVTDAIADPRGRDEFVNNWKAIRDAAGEGNEVTSELAQAVGMTAEQFKGLSQTDLNEMVKQIEGAANAASEAEAQVKALAEATGTNTIEAAALAKNYEILSSNTSSASQKFSALKQNLDILNDGQRTASDTQRDYQQSLSDTAGAIDEIISREGVVAAQLVNTRGEFDLTSQAGRDLYTAYSDSADSILELGASVFDAARKQGASMEEAQATAMASMDGPIQSFRASLAELGIAPPIIDAIVDKMGLVPDEINTALNANGDQALMEAARVQLAMDAYKSGNYTAVLAALPDQAKTAIGEALGMTEEFSNGNYEAILKAFDDTPGGREAALAALLTFEGTEWTAFLKANNLVPEEVAKANAATLNDKTSTFKATDGVTPAAAIANNVVLSDKEADLIANDLASDVVSTINGLAMPGKNAKLTATDSVSAVLTTVNNSPLNDKGSKLTTRDLVTQVLAQVNNSPLRDKLNRLNTTDLVSSVVDAVNRKGMPGKANTLTTQDLVTEVINRINNTPLHNKSNTITTTYLENGTRPGRAGATIFAGNNGGILNATGAVAFANGGIFDNVKSFANGSENHVAQIARGKWPFRIWAEEETGGEAYLPLAKSKRTRSLKILKQVAEMFGFDLFKKFADGGIMSGMNIGSGSNPTRSFYGNSTSGASVGVSGVGTGMQPVVVVNPSPGMDERVIGESAAISWFWESENR